MSEKKNVPELRFEGFEEPWKKKSIGEVTDVLSASRVHKDEWVSNGVPFYRSSDVVSAYKGKENEKAYISFDLYEELIKASGKLEENDILITGGGSIGIPFIVSNDDPLYSKDADLIWIKHSTSHNSQYLYSYFISRYFRDYISSISHVGTIAHYTIEQVKDTPVSLPGILEQKVIGDLFREIDTLLTLQQRKCERLKNIKKAMLEKMFPCEGCDVPEIRFEGFSGAWERKRICDVANRFDNLRIPVAANLRVPGKTPYYGANGIQDYVKGVTHDGEFVLVAEDGANDLKNYPVQYVNGQIWVNNHAHVLQSKIGIADNAFLAYSISQADIESLLVGGGRAKLNAEVMMQIEFRIPCKSEQIAIGQYLTKLDHLITLHQQKHEKLKQLKQSLLEKMFV